jgi:segregation and condensation protein B
MTSESLLEAVLFAAARPLSLKKLAEIVQLDADDVQSDLEHLRERLDASESGVMLQNNGSDYELVTRPEASDAVAKVVTAELQGELSRPSLEALSILAYCGPMTRPELEQIRGVQSAMILRNLMLRGLVEQKEELRFGQPVFAVTFDFLNHLGIENVTSLPHYEDMRGHAAVADVLAQLQESVAPST